MARVTIEDCLPYVENRFKLVLVAAQRAREILGGSPLLICDNQRHTKDKEDVLALREIGAGLLDTKILDESIIKKYQKFQPFVENSSSDVPDDVVMEDEDAGNEVITNMYAVESCDNEFGQEVEEESSETK